MSAEPVRIAAFDLDDTVLHGDSQLLFMRHLAAKRLVPASLLLEVACYYALHRAGVPLDVPRLYTRIILRGARMAPDAFAAAMHEFATTRLRPRVRADARAWMTRTRDAGCHVVLLSASLEPMLAVVAADLRVDGYVGNRLIVGENGRLVLDGEMIYADAKVRALQRYADARFPAWRLEYAFGNDYGDRFLLNQAANPLAVCPSPRLRAVAERERWPSVTWR